MENRGQVCLEINSQGTFRIDGLGNILADARKNDASIFADEVIAIADKHGLGTYLTGVDPGWRW